MGKKISLLIMLILFFSMIFFPVTTGQSTKLIIHTSPVVIEAQSYTVTVTDEEGHPLNNVLIIVGAYGGEAPGGYYTNREGTVQLYAPTVTETTPISITANKIGYEDNVTRVIVIDSTQRQLVITAPSHVSEGEPFPVTVTVAEDILLPDTTLTFVDQTVTTSYEGIATLIAPSTNVNVEYIISATKEGFLTAYKPIIIENQEIPKPNEKMTLTITLPSSVDEHTDFQIHVTVNTTPVSHAQVFFNSMTVETNENGVATFTAPTIQEDTTFQIQASKEGYQPTTTSILIRNVVLSPIPGWIFGRIVDSSGEPVTDVQVCVTAHINNNCTTSDSKGDFTLTVPPEEYSISAQKQGFVTSSLPHIIVKENSGSAISITLVKIEPQDWGDYVIQYGTEQGIIGATISVNEDSSKEIKVFNSNITIAITPLTSGTFAFTVAAPNGTQPSVIAIEIADINTILNSKISSLKHIAVSFDGQPLSLANNFQEIFEYSSDAQPVWAGLITEKKCYLLIPSHFSTHTIIISTLQEQLNTPMMLFLYLACLLITILISTLHMKRVWRK